MPQEGEEPVEAVPLKVMVTALAGDGERLLQVGIDMGLLADELMVKLFALIPQSIEEPTEFTALTRTRVCVDTIVAGMLQDADVAGG